MDGSRRRVINATAPVRICDLEKKWAELPFIYTLREDFIRAMSGVENKLNKILDRLPAAKGE